MPLFSLGLAYVAFIHILFVKASQISRVKRCFHTHTDTHTHTHIHKYIQYNAFAGRKGQQIFNDNVIY
jgi:hypothetical protein